MRFLRQTSPDQLRLGWLRVIANAVGTQRMPLIKLKTEIEQVFEASDEWIKGAGFIEPPTGKISPTHTSRLPRMGANYGIQSEETEMLTDLGHVLRLVAPWSPNSPDNPLIWLGESRWIGFSIVLRAAGDVVLSLLRGWTAAEHTNAELAEKLALVLSTLARHGTPEERSILHRQAEGASPVNKNFKAHAILYPYVEPLRDLGYLTRVMLPGGGGGYQLSPRGRRICDTLRSFDGDIEALLRSGVSRVFLLGEGLDTLTPAPGYALAKALAAMPPELTVFRPEEVPLDAAVLLAQASLVRDAPGMWIDLRLAGEMLKAVGQRGAKVEVKRGESVHELNVAWRDAALLSDDALWDVSIEAHDPFVVRTTVAPPAQPAETPSFVTEVPPLDERDGDEDVVEESTAPEAAPEPDATSPESRRMVGDDISLPLRLWLQYVDHILAPPTAGALDLPRWGGLTVGLTRLRGLVRTLDDARLAHQRSLGEDIILHPAAPRPSNKPPCMHPISRLEELLSHVHDDWLHCRITEAWLDKETRRSPLSILERGMRYSARFTEKIMHEIKAFVEQTSDNGIWKKWLNVREATRSIVHDTIADGAWSAPALRAQLQRELRRHGASDGARRWLGALVVTAPKEFNYVQRRHLTLEIHELLRLDRLEENEKTKDHESGYGAITLRVNPVPEDAGIFVEFSVLGRARSAFEAKVLGRQRVHAWLDERYATECVNPNLES